MDYYTIMNQDVILGQDRRIGNPYLSTIYPCPIGCMAVHCHAPMFSIR